MSSVGSDGRPSRRRPPAYQVYASDDLASEEYYNMNLAERGLYDAMLRCCWVGGSVPKDPSELALAVRRPTEEVQAALTRRVLKYFVADTADGTRLISNELSRQAANLEARRGAQEAAARRTNKAKAKKRQDSERGADRCG